LEPFGRSDAEYFFGREQESAELLDRLDRDGTVLITGPSASGKSSLMLAGILPALTRQSAEVTVFRPADGRSPWSAFAAVLADYLSDGEISLHDIEELAARLEAEGVEDAMNRILVRHDLRRLVVAVDQFDEAGAASRTTMP
jgi:hypothetical protein